MFGSPETRNMDLRINRLLIRLLILLIITAIPTLGHHKKGIRSVDFYNFSYHSEIWGDNISLRKGEYARKDPVGETLYTRSKLIALKYADFNKDGKEDVAVAMRTLLNGSMPVAMDYYVFEYRSGKAQQIFYKWQEGPEGLCVKGHSLIITAALWEKGDAHCCPRYTEQAVYRWRGKGIVVASRRRWRNHPFQHPDKLERLLHCK
jgi:hypothetical protein